MKWEIEQSPLLRQEGWREAPGWFQGGNAENWRFWNHPSRDPLRDPAALLTPEGNSLTSNSFLLPISDFLFRVIGERTNER
jgi:hypothetical protein